MNNMALNKTEELPVEQIATPDEPEITYKNPRTKDADFFIELDVYHDGEYVYPTGMVKGCEYTNSLYELAMSGEFGEITMIKPTTA